MILRLYGHDRLYDLQSMATAFFPDRGFGEDGMEVDSRAHEENGRLVCETVIACGGRTAQACAQSPAAEPGAARTAVKRSFYLAAAQLAGQTPVWGMFTGIRPVKEMAGYVTSFGAQAARRFADAYDAAPEKAALCADTLALRREIGFAPRPREISAYISIPFCPSRCSYCSFISQAGEKMLALLPDYLERLCGEIRLYGDALRGSGLALRSVYVGGGTPAVLSAAQIRTLLQTARRALPMDGVQEFTFEAGRPDAADAEKLRVLREYGVDRVSVNPQTLHDTTLARIGRRHTAAQFYAAYEQAARLGFRCINTDLILGLPGESEDDMLESVNGILALSPQNVTLHALCLKKSARLKTEGETQLVRDQGAVSAAARAQARLRERGYRPYYIYRQKNAVGGLENTGYTQPGRASYYNMVMMDDLQTVLGFGAGAISKYIRPGADPVRAANHKFPYEYIADCEKIENNLRILKDMTKADCVFPASEI